MENKAPSRAGERDLRQVRTALMQATDTMAEPLAHRPGHEALLYQGDRGFLAETVPFIRAGLTAGEPIMVAVSGARIQKLARALGEDADQVHFVDMQAIGTNPARIIPAWVQFVEDASPDGRLVRGIGEPIWPQRSGPELAECERHEALLNLVLAQHPQLHLLCPYDISALSPDALHAGLRTHPVLLQQGDRRSSEDYVGMDPATAPFAGPLPAPPSPVHQMEFSAGQCLEVRAFVARHALTLKLPTVRRADLEWAAAELVTNSIRHGGGRGTVRVWEESGGLVCEVQDQGRLDNPLAGRARPEESAAQGRGLWLVNQLCELVQIRSSAGSTTVRIHVKRTQSGREVAEVRLLADQMLAAWDRFRSNVERRLSQAERSLLWALSPEAESALMSLPDRGLTIPEFERLAAAAKPALELRAELEAATMVRSQGEAPGEVRLTPTQRARRLRDAVAAARQVVLEEMLSRVDPDQLAAVAPTMLCWQRG